MATTFKAACIQNCAGREVAANIEETERLTREAVAAGADFVSLPEYFSGLDVENGRLKVPAFPEDEHPALAHFRALARELSVVLNLGSLPIVSGAGKAFNRGYMIDCDGVITARYDKIHLFDVDLADGESYRESDTIQAGKQPVLAETPWCTMGLSICYDLRFAQLYRILAQAGAEVLLIPAAFTRTTGKAHWHLLNRARAIETGCFVIAACQGGTHESGAETYGHSLIVAPWGEVLADGGEETGFVMADIDLEQVARGRHMIPAWQDNQAFTVTQVEPLRLAGE